MTLDALASARAEVVPGSGPVVLQEVLCSGSEHKLIDCIIGYRGTSSCSHSQDAGVVCVDGEH